jgi:hypothetical protein
VSTNSTCSTPHKETNLDDIGAVGSTREVERSISFAGKGKTLLCHFVIHCNQKKKNKKQMRLQAVGSEEEKKKRRGFICTINLVGDNDNRNTLSIFLQLLVPIVQVLVSQLSCNVEALCVHEEKEGVLTEKGWWIFFFFFFFVLNHDAAVCSKIIGRVHAVEPLLACGVPKI